MEPPLECERSSVEGAVLRKIKPRRDEEEEAKRIASEALRIADAALRQAGYSGYRLTIEGSFAKGTWLRGELDLDIFALFDPNTCLDVAAGFAEHVAHHIEKMGYPVELRYAQHPYVRFLVEGVWAELVPGCIVKNPREIITPVDRTPFHREYINRVLAPWQRDEVRLLKSFLKGIGVYGAEIAVEGFSGYLAELLIVKYGCFRRVINAAAYWRPPVRLCIESNCKFTEAHKITSAMHFPDPVDPSRNAAAAVSLRSLGIFVLASKLYNTVQCEYFFHAAQPSPPKIQPWQWGSRIENIALIEIVPGVRVSPDNFWGIVKRVARVVTRQLSVLGFNVLYTSTNVEENHRDGLVGFIYVEVEEGLLPPYTRAEGPPAWGPSSRVTGFVSKNLGTVGPNGELIARRRRRIRGLSEALRNILSRDLPGSVHEIKATVSMLYGLEAAERVAQENGKWPWETLNTTMYWLWLVAENCVKQ